MRQTVHWIGRSFSISCFSRELALDSFNDRNDGLENGLNDRDNWLQDGFNNRNDRFQNGSHHEKRWFLGVVFGLLVEKNHIKQRLVHLDAAVVIDIAERTEAIHEETDAGPRGADHLRQRLL